jgi:hypothetical protein
MTDSERLNWLEQTSLFLDKPAIRIVWWNRQAQFAAVDADGKGADSYPTLREAIDAAMAANRVGVEFVPPDENGSVAGNVPPPTWLGFHVKVDAEMPPNRLDLMQNDKVVARVENLVYVNPEPSEGEVLPPPRVLCHECGAWNAVPSDNLCPSCALPFTPSDITKLRDAATMVLAGESWEADEMRTFLNRLADRIAAVLPPPEA